MDGENTQKTCFVICPINEEGTETRIQSDYVLSNIIKPVLEAENYLVLRSDHIKDPGIISSQIIEYLKDSDIVIADLRDKNSNVFYELGIRHTINKPVITLYDFKEDLPFDISHNRTIYYSFDEEKIEKYRQELKETLYEIISNPDKCRNLVSQSISYSELYSSKLTENDLLIKIYDLVKILSKKCVTDTISQARESLEKIPSAAEKRLEEIDYELFNLNLKRNGLARSSNQLFTKKMMNVYNNDISQIDAKISQLNEEKLFLSGFLDTLNSNR